MYANVYANVNVDRKSEVGSLERIVSSNQIKPEQNFSSEILLLRKKEARESLYLHSSERSTSTDTRESQYYLRILKDLPVI